MWDMINITILILNFVYRRFIFAGFGVGVYADQAGFLRDFYAGNLSVVQNDYRSNFHS